VFIELAEFLRCPNPHDESYCVVTPDDMDRRTVVTGAVGCPTCHTEYPIRDGIVDFRPPDGRSTPAPKPQDGAAPPHAVQALLALSGPGGYVVLVGSAARSAQRLTSLVGGVHFVGVNAPVDVRRADGLSLLLSIDAVPLRSSMARGVVVGGEWATAPWLDEAARILLRGRRLLVLAEVPGPSVLNELAIGDGMWVGEKR